MKRYGDRTWRPSKPKDRFKPTREQIQSAVEEYLKNGGKITKIVELPMSDLTWDKEADFYLRGK